MGASGTPGSKRTWFPWRHRPQLNKEPDAVVEVWKKSWMEGADAAWAMKPQVNPHTDEPERAAWQAGWTWAKTQPDRRTERYLRLAHPKRRASDSSGRVLRVVKVGAVGAVGVGLFAATGWAWRKLRRVRSEEKTAK